MKKKTVWQKLCITTSLLIGLITLFLGVVYLIFVMFGRATSLAYLLAHSGFYDIFFVFLLSILSLIQLVIRNNIRPPHRFYPSWLKDALQMDGAEFYRNQTEDNKDFFYITIGIAIIFLFCLIAIEVTLV